MAQTRARAHTHTHTHTNQTRWINNIDRDTTVNDDDTVMMTVSDIGVKAMLSAFTRMQPISVSLYFCGFVRKTARKGRVRVLGGRFLNQLQISEG